MQYQKYRYYIIVSILYSTEVLLVRTLVPQVHLVINLDYSTLPLVLRLTCTTLSPSSPTALHSHASSVHHPLSLSLSRSLSRAREIVLEVRLRRRTSGKI
jgi:hypothetical protein